MVFDDAAAAGAALAAEIADGIASANGDGRRYLLGCPGGRSPRATYAALATEVATRGLDLSGLVIVMMDDYLEPDGSSYRRVPATAHFSCENFAMTEIAGPVSAGARGGTIRPDAVWLPDPRDPAAYDDQLRAAGGIDLFILASGASDGHVAFNPPGTPAGSRTRVVRLADTTRHDNLATFPRFRDVSEVPRYGVTVGVELIFFYAVLTTLIGLVLAGVMARSRIRGLNLFRALLFLPYVIAPTAIAVIWRWLLAPDGPLNTLMSDIGLDGLTRPWLGDFTLALPTVGLTGSWVMCGLAMVLLLAGVQKIPGDLFDAARIDGAGAIREFFAVTLPGLRNEIIVVLVLTVTAALRNFDVIYVMTQGGPGTSTTVPSLLVYNQAFVVGSVGAAAAIGAVLAALIFIVNALITRIGEH
jgi:ABC-type sugar transport system permease subunit